MAKLVKEYEGSLCEVKSIENALLATGVIRDVEDEFIDIESRTGISSNVGYGTEVKVTIFNTGLGFCVLAGNVYLYGEDFIRVTDLISILDYERRHFFRIETNIDGIMIFQKPKRDPEGEASQDAGGSAAQGKSERQGSGVRQSGVSGQADEAQGDEDEEVPEELGPPIEMEVKVADLSLGGCRVRIKERIFELGDRFKLRLTLRRKRQVTLDCRVLRIEEEERFLMYGCTFENKDIRQEDELCAYVLQLQAQMIREARG